MSAIDNVSAALEALIFASNTPTSPQRIRRVFKDMTPAKIAEAVKAINTQLDKDGRPYQIAEVAGGYQFRTRPEYGPVLRAAQPERKVRLSRAALECLAVISYKQPLTRAELEELRSVDCGAILKSLLERDLVRILGRRDAPGRPSLYGTTTNFLQLFGLASLRDLPSLREIESMAVESGVSIEEASGNGLSEQDTDSADLDSSDDDPDDAQAELEAGAAEDDEPEVLEEIETDATSEWTGEEQPEEEDASA